MKVNRLKHQVVAALAALSLVGAAGAEVPLPADYVRLDWISSSTGAEYIDTRYVLQSGEWVSTEIELAGKQPKNYTAVFGCTTDGRKDPFFAFQPNFGSATATLPTYIYGGAVAKGSSNTFPTGVKVALTCQGTKARWSSERGDGSVEINNPVPANCTSSLFIFWQSRNPPDVGCRTKMKLYSFKILFGDLTTATVSRNYVPCRRRSDGEAGLYETVKGKFHPNARTSRSSRFIGSDEPASALEASIAAPADDYAHGKAKPADGIPVAPEGYRRPKDWKPVLYPKNLHQIAKDHSAEVMARAQKQMDKVNDVNTKGRWKATGASMDEHKCPEWFIDAKLGIFIDWGPWSVASWCPYAKGKRLYPDWYESRCRSDRTTIRYHEKNWGKDFKSDHLLDLFRGTKFNAPELMKIFRHSGARYVIPFLKHHSGFCLWDCSYTFRDTMDMAAHRDFAREMVDACRAEGLKFGIYISQAGEWEYPILQGDGSIKIADGRPDHLRRYSSDMEWKCSGKVAVKDFVHDYTVPQTTEFIDKYDPDILWGDFDWVTEAHRNGSYEIAAYFYNRAEGRKEVACNDRCGIGTQEEMAKYKKLRKKLIGLRTIRGDYYTDEWGDIEVNIDPASWHPWESCSGISKSYGNHWMENFDPSMVMTEKEFICHFSGIVARGGNLLLLVNLDPQGAFPEIQKTRLEQIGQWLSRWGEAIYATRILAPFSTKKIDYTQSKDGRYAYAIVKEPAAEVALECELPETTQVTVVGETKPLATRREGKNTVVTIPEAYAKGSLPFALKCSR